MPVDPNEILKVGCEVLKQGPEVAKSVVELFGAFKLPEITKVLLGPAAAEIAERIHDEVRFYRFGRQLEMLKKAAKMVKDAGFSPKAVPIKLLFPLLEGGSFEENEDLHTMWAALLANASSPEGSEKVRPGFIAILKQMAPDEAVLLTMILELPTKLNTALGESGFGEFEIEIAGGLRFLKAVPNETYLKCLAIMQRTLDENRLRFPRLDGESDRAELQRFEVCIQTLSALGLIDSSHPTGEFRHVGLTARGKAFLYACSPPKPGA
jgi:hypothetical protein